MDLFFLSLLFFVFDVPCTTSGFGAEHVHYKFFKVRHISSKQAKGYLCKADTGTVSLHPSEKTILVTATSSQMRKVSSILELVDSNEAYSVVRVKEPAAAAAVGSGCLKSGVEGITLGSFSEPPAEGSPNASIVDFDKNGVLIVAPSNKCELIRNRLIKEGPERAVRTGVLIELDEPNETAKSEPNEAAESEPNEATKGEPNEAEEIEPNEVESENGGVEANEPNVLSALVAPFEPNEIKTEDANEAKTDMAAEPNESEMTEPSVEPNETSAADVNEPNDANAPAEPNEIELPVAEPNETATTEVNEPNEVERALPEPNEPNVGVVSAEGVEEPNEANLLSKGEGVEEPNFAAAEKAAADINEAVLPEEVNELAAEGAGFEANEPNKEPVALFEEKAEAADVNEAEAKEAAEVTEGAIEPNVPDVVQKKKTAKKVESKATAEGKKKTTIEEEEPVKEAKEVDEWGQYEPPPVPNAEQVLNLDLPEKLPMKEFLGFMGEQLHLDFLYNPEDIKGDVVLMLKGKLRGGVKRKELYPLLEAVLKFNGYAMTRHKNLILIVPSGKAMEYDPEVFFEGGQTELGEIIITRIFDLEHIDAGSVKNLLDGMKLGLSPQHIDTSISQAGKLIVTDYAYRMKRVEKLIEMIDKPGERRKFRFRRLKYTTATNLAPKIKTLAEQLGTVTITVSEPEAQPQQGKQPQGRPPRHQAQPKPQPSQGNGGEPGVYLDADERTNRILMIGLAEDLDTVEELIVALDVEKQDLRTLRMYEINYVEAEDIINNLSELNIISGEQASQRITSRDRGGRRRAQPKSPQQEALGGEEEPLAEEPQIVLIDATNSLLINATPEQHEQIAMVIGYLDVETVEASIPYVVYPLENESPTRLKDLLQQLVQETITKVSEKGDNKVERTTTTQSAENISIVADPNSYSLIVYASKKDQQWIKSIIEQLDQYRPQVLLDVTLVQVTKDDMFNFDLKLLSSIPDLTNTSGYTVGEEDQSIIDKLINDTHQSRFVDFRAKEGALTAFYGSDQIHALLTAMETKKYGRVMARPKLLVNDNENGTISTTDTTYVKKTEQQWLSGDNPVQTEQVSYPSYSAGITLDIRPHISTGNMLRLNIALNRSGFTSELSGERPPDKADAEVETVVNVPDKSTIILGGMEKIQDNKGGEKVPILGDLPLIGGLFRKVSRSGEQDKLYIFVKAHILRPGGDLALADLKDVSLENRRKFEQLEAEMQEYEDWPGVKARPLDPVHILEMD